MTADKNRLEEEACILRFYKIVLSWDYIRLLNESSKKNFNKKIGDGSALGLKEVKGSYKDVDDYLSTFEPLLFEEVKAQIVQEKEEEDETERQQAVIAECSEVNGFYLPMVICSDSKSVSQNDLLLLSNKKLGEGKVLPTAYVFALFEHCQHDKIKLRLNLSGELKGLNTDDVQTSSRLMNMRPLVSEVQKYLYILKICSLSTIVCEYVALRSVSSFPFKDLILTAAENNYTTEDQAWKISKPLTAFIEGNHNKSQLEAIHGPPGTEKHKLSLVFSVPFCTLLQQEYRTNTITGKELLHG